MANVTISETIRVTATFRGWSATGTGTAQDPDTVVVSILNGAGIVLTDNITPVHDSLGIYHYDWTASALGTFTIRFLGTFVDATTDAIDTTFQVGPFDSSLTSLSEDQYIAFLVDPTPFMIDPEDFLATYPDATAYQVAELIYQFSVEAGIILGPFIQDPVQQQKVVDFVEASTNCALSRIYDPGMGANETAITLGDLTVQTRNVVKTTINRATATTWCELAAVIRNELYAVAKKGGMKAIMKGSKYFNPMPPRYIQHIEWRNWSDYAGS